MRNVSADNGIVPEQDALLELPEQPEHSRPDAGTGVSPARKLCAVDRSQMMMRCISTEELIPPDHKARGIWELVGRLSLARFEEPIRSLEGGKGRPALPPQLLISIWLYGYSEGITSARELERLMDYEPGLQWLAGLEIINHHTLSDFRVGHKEALDDFFTQLLVAMEKTGWVKLECVMHDGTKIRSQAGADSLRREEKLAEKLAAARQLVSEDPQAEPGTVNKRREAARQRAQREREQRLETALAEAQEVQKALDEAGKKERARVSMTEPEARKMKHGDNAMAPSYNVQVSTDEAQGVIVGVQLTQCRDDSHQLVPAVEEVKANLGSFPRQVVADGGFTNKESIQAMEKTGIDFIGSLRDPKERAEAAVKAHGIEPRFAPHFFILQPASNTLECPGGKQLKYMRQSGKRGDRYLQYRARAEDCLSCEYQKQCCPGSADKGRTVSVRQSEDAAVARFRDKMNTPEARDIYRKRGAVAEFPFAWLKEKFGVRKFRVFGMAKAAMEATWACLAFNSMIWLRLSAVSSRAAMRSA